VSAVPRGGPPGRALAWIAAGITVLGLAFAVHPVHASRTVFLCVLAGGAAAIVTGSVVSLRELAVSRRTKRAAAAERRRLLAFDCRSLRDALAEFALECGRLRPPRLLGTGREEDSRSSTCARYRNEFRAWALKVFDEAVLVGAVSTNSRTLVQEPAATQLTALRDLFGDIALGLEPS
jgi:hypothetical protein